MGKVIQMADIHTVNFLRAEMPPSVLLNVHGTYVFECLFNIFHSRTFCIQNVVPNRWVCGGQRILTAVQ